MEKPLPFYKHRQGLKRKSLREGLVPAPKYTAKVTRSFPGANLVQEKKKMESSKGLLHVPL
jgi:hypothetical protein